MSGVQELTVPNASGLCMCGCGQRTKIADKTRVETGWVQGEHMRYIHGHHAKGPNYRVDAETGCWEWLKARNVESGYGQISDKKLGTRLAHRVVWEEERGPIPPGMQIDHLCRNRGCVNPDHLEVVTPAENTRRGIRVKLTLSDAKAIRREFGIKRAEIEKEIAARYDVTVRSVKAIVNGDSWKDDE